MLDWQFILLVITAVIYCFINGRNDGRNVVATMVSSRSIQPKNAIILASAVEFIVPLIIGTAVANTICTGIVSPEELLSGGKIRAYIFIFSALSGAMLFSSLSNRLGLPSSASHALIGGMIGGGIILYGLNSILWYTILIKVILMLFLTPILGMLMGFIIMWIINIIFQNASYSFNEHFKRAQLLGAAFLAGAHSSNDAQKSMGVIAVLMLMSGLQNDFTIPFWVKFVCALALSSGLYFAGWKVVKTVGRDIFRLKPVESFSSQLGSSVVLCASGLLGSPVSTSQIVSSTVVGVGAMKNPKAVKWDVVGRIFISWITTIPASAMISAALTALIYYGIIGGGFI